METIFATCSLDRTQVQWEDYLYQLTPAEKIGDIWWKREDKFAPLGAGHINGSKLRQLIWLMTRQPIAGVVSGAVMQSPQLIMAATVAKHLGVPCHQFSGGHRDSVLAAEALDAETHVVNPGYPAILNSKARRFASEHGHLWIETNITIEHKSSQPERIEAFHRVGSEQCRNIPDHIENLLIPAGSCNSLTSILYGLGRFKPRSLKNILLFRIMKNADKRRNWTNERRAYPYFFLYVVLQVVAFPSLFLLNTVSYAAYYYAFYGVTVASVSLSVAVFWDVFKNALAPYDRLRRWAITGFWMGIVALLAATVAMSFGSQANRHGAGWMPSAVSFTRLGQGALVLLIFFFRKYLVISRRNFAFGVALGFGLFAVVDMLVTTEVPHAAIPHKVLSRFASLAYLLANVIWLAYAVHGSTGPASSRNVLLRTGGEVDEESWHKRNVDGTASAAE